MYTACSRHNFELVQSYGADYVFDYHEHNVGAKIRHISNNSIKRILDTVSEDSTARICADTMSDSGGRYTSILQVDFPRTDCTSDLVMAYTAFGEDYRMGPQAPLQKVGPEDKEFSAMFFDLAEELLAAQKFRPHEIQVKEGGLSGVLEGLQLLRDGKMSGKKLVYRTSDKSPLP